MANGRMLNKKISMDTKVAKITNPYSLLIYTWGIAHLDVKGRMYGDPEVFRSIVSPRIDVTTEEVAEFMSEWAEQGLVEWYESDGDTWIQYNGFRKNQKNLREDREAPSEIPDPDTGHVEKIVKYKNSGYIYIIKYDGYCKIGRAKNPTKRISQLKTALPGELEIIHQFWTEDVVSKELEIHKKYNDKRVRGEWFNLKETEIANIIIESNKECGSTPQNSAEELPPKLKESKLKESNTSSGTASRSTNGKKVQLQEEDKELYHKIKDAFLSQNDTFTNWKKEGESIKRLVKQAKVRSPDNPEEFMHQMIEQFWKMKQSGEKFWKEQPFTPSRLASSGIFDQLLETFREESIPDELKEYYQEKVI